MTDLTLKAQRLQPSLARAARIWLVNDEIVGRSGAENRAAGQSSVPTILRFVLTVLEEDDPQRVIYLARCKAALRLGTMPSGAPWNTFENGDALSAIYTTSRVLSDLAPYLTAHELVDEVLTSRGYASLVAFLSNPASLLESEHLPIVYRCAAALQPTHHLPDDIRIRVGSYAQANVHKYLALRSIGLASKVDRNLLAYALALDTLCSRTPLSRLEREAALIVVLEPKEILPSVSRSTLMRCGTNVIGSSSFEALLALFTSASLRQLLLPHMGSIAQVLDWLEDHSEVRLIEGHGVRLFQNDLWPQYNSYDAWCNALVNLFISQVEIISREQEQHSLRMELFARQPNGKVQYVDLISGGFAWPELLRHKLLNPVQRDGKTSDATGNGIVLFGPPGTGKTTMAQVIATQLDGWTFVRLSSADFLVEGKEGIFRTIRNIFAKLKRLYQCVVFFDEVELLVLDRDSTRADWGTGIITNVMLPELQDLHDSQYVIPIFATNYVDRLDHAGRRPGRFDYVLPVGLPSELEADRVLRRMLPAAIYSEQLKSIPKGATLQELQEWAKTLAAQSTAPDMGLAYELWRPVQEHLRVTPDDLKLFDQSVEKYSYPASAGIRVKK